MDFIKNAGKFIVNYIKTKLKITLIPIAILVAIALAVILIWFQGVETSSKVSEKAAKVIKTGVTLENGEIKIHDDVYDKIRETLKKEGIDPDSIYLGEKYKYLEKMVQAEVVTNYPDTGKGKIRGAVKIYRQKSDGSAAFAMTYKSMTDFDKLYDKAKSNQKKGDVDNVIKCFTIDDNWNIVIARYNKVTEVDAKGKEKSSYSLEKSTLSYMNKVAPYTMSFEFLNIMMLVTSNPNYIDALADLVIKKTDIRFTIMDSTSIYTEINEHSYYKKTVQTSYDTKDEAGTIKIAGSDKETFWYSDQVVETTKTITEVNEIIAEVTYVKTWIYDKIITYNLVEKPEEQIAYDKEVIDDYIIEGPTTKSKTNYNSILTADDNTYTFTTTTVYMNKETFIQEGLYKKATWVKSPDATEQSINPDLFLGLWKNKDGKYKEGALYDPDGKVVKYKIPDTGFWKSPAETIVEYPDVLFYQLSLTERTQSYELLMRYILYIYTGNNYGITEDDLTMLLDIFGTSDFSGFGTSGTFDLYTPTLSKEEFIQAMQEYTYNQAYEKNFKPYAEEIWNTATTYEYPINPELVVVLAQAEGGYSRTRGYAYNYWGYGCSNDTNAGTAFTSISDGIKSLARSMHAYGREGSDHYNAIMAHYEARQTSGCNPLGYGLPGSLSGWQSRYSGIFIHGDPNNLSHETTDRLNPKTSNGKASGIYKTYEEYVERCVNVHPVGSQTTAWEQGQYTAWQVEQKLDTWNKIFGKYGSLGTAGGSDIPVADGSAKEKLDYLFPDGVPTSAAEMQKYLGPVEVDLTTKDGTKIKKTLTLHKAVHKDVQEVFKAAQDSGFKIYEAQGYNWRESHSGSRSHHSYGIAIDINVKENYMPGVAGEFWDPAKSEFSIPRGGVLEQAFKAKGWGWGGDWKGTKDYMHFSFTGW